MKFDPNLKFEDDSVATIGILQSGYCRFWYYINRPGMLHRKNGPAMESDCGAAWYYLYGKLHRIGGPAQSYDHPNNNVNYWIEGIEYESKEEYLKNCKVYLLK